MYSFSVYGNTKDELSRLVGNYDKTWNENKNDDVRSLQVSCDNCRWMIDLIYIIS